MSRLTIVRPGLPLPPATPNDETIAFEEFRRWIRTGRVLGHLGRHSDGRMLVQRLETAGRPLPLAMALRALCRGHVYLEDISGRRRTLTAGQLTKWILQLVIEPFRVAALLQNATRQV